MWRGLRAVDFRTIVPIPDEGVRIDATHKIALLGSCFAHHVGGRMRRAGLDVCAEAFGTLYNPASVAAACRVMAGLEMPGAGWLVQGHGLWHSWMHDGSFSALDRDDCLRRMHEACHRCQEELPRLDVLCITLGTNHCYVHRSWGRVVANCHKQPAADFSEQVLCVDAVVQLLDEALQALWQVRPTLQVVFTVSPYRYAKYGMHASQLGKAVLLLATDALCRRHEGRCSYFPAYELVLDELRDYRYYAPDMLHPSEVAADYIWERFAESRLTPAARELARQWQPLWRAAQHRPLHADDPAHAAFVRTTLQRMELLAARYPHLWHNDDYIRLKASL